MTRVFDRRGYPMKTLTRPRRLIVAALVVLVAAVVQPIAAHAAPQRATITMKQIGTPTWKPVDAHVFSAPIGTAASGYVEFGESQASLLPPPDHVPHPQLGIGPGAPHGGFSREMGDGVRRSDFDEADPFFPTQFSNGQAIWLAFMVVPTAGAPLGRSPDFRSGPIIPNKLFPLHVELSTLRNGSLFSAPGAFDVPPLDGKLTPPFHVDGHSHFPTFYADNADFKLGGGPLNGDYTFKATLRDVKGNGWDLVASFAVTGPKGR
jgi:hypothetical protein